MKRALSCAAALTAILGGCADEPETTHDRRPASAAQPAPQEQSSPAPGAAIPRKPGPLADRLATTHSGLAAAIGRWRSEGDLSSHPPPRDVTRWALHQQRIHLLLTDRPALSRKVLRRLPGRPAAHLRATIRARRGLSKITPLTPGRYRTGKPEPPRELLRYYRKAQRRFGVPWPVLAAVNFVESGFNKLQNNSAAGAQGPMQFIPSTWRAYGMGGDVHDPHDAIMGAANYLSASGAPEDLTGALYAYNPSDLYVRAVLAYTDRIRRDRNSFLSYYSWQIFVRMPSGGTRRITGPRPF
jgi:soluble lytic murein transglycosylase-like protein